MVAADTSTPSEAEARAALDRVLRSAQLERSARLQDFLKYICETALRGEGAKINEYLIGTEVFGRTDDYSPGDDSIVRRQAHVLRQKLQKYYETTDDPIRIELPMGRYVPGFRRISPAVAPAQASEPGPAIPINVAAAAPAAPAQGAGAWTRYSLAAVAAVALIGTGWAAAVLLRPATAPVAAVQPASAPAIAPVLRQFWGPWLQPGVGVTLCMTNSTAALIDQIEDPAWRPDSERFVVDPGSAADVLLRDYFKLATSGRLVVHPVRGQGKLREAIAVVHLTTLFARAQLPVRPMESRFLTWNLLRRENVILVDEGSLGRWTKVLLDKTPWRPVLAGKGPHQRIVNFDPRPGEVASYENQEAAGPDGVREQQIALISMLPGLDVPRELLVIHGLGSQATELAAEFLINPERVADLAAQLAAAQPASGKKLTHFQAVLRAEVRDSTPTRGTIVAVRLLP